MLKWDYQMDTEAIMENYYQLLGLNENALVGELDADLKKLQRKWQSRTNAPDLTKRQEAEVMLKHVIDAKAILTDEKKKTDYEKQLKKLKTSDTKQVVPNGYESSELLNEAKAMIRSNQIADAILLLKRLTMEDPHNADAQINYGYCLYRMQRYTEAIPVYETVLAMHPNDMNIFYDLIYIYVEMKQFSIAEQYLTRAFKTVGEVEPFLRLKTYILNAQQKYDETIQIVESQKSDGKALSKEIILDLCEAYEGKTMAFYQKGKDGYYYLTVDTHVEEVLKYWEKIIAHKDVFEDPQYPQTQYNKVANLKKKQFFKGAWKAYIIPLLFLFGSSSMMAEGDPSAIMMVLATIGYMVFLTYLAMVPGFKRNNAAVNGKKLGIQHILKLNGAIVGIFGFFFALLVRTNFSNNRR